MNLLLKSWCCRASMCVRAYAWLTSGDAVSENREFPRGQKRPPAAEIANLTSPGQAEWRHRQVLRVTEILMSPFRPRSARATVAINYQRVCVMEAKEWTLAIAFLQEGGGQEKRLFSVKIKVISRACGRNVKLIYAHGNKKWSGWKRQIINSWTLRYVTGL